MIAALGLSGLALTNAQCSFSSPATIFPSDLLAVTDSSSNENYDHEIMFDRSEADLVNYDYRVWRLGHADNGGASSGTFNNDGTGVAGTDLRANGYNDAAVLKFNYGT